LGVFMSVATNQKMGFTGLWGGRCSWRWLASCFRLVSISPVVSALRAMDDTKMSLGLGFMDEESENHGSTIFGQHY
jgi:hypothetical protein